MRAHTIITSEGVVQFTKILYDLRSSLDDLISIADNIIPEELINKGLKEYLTNACKSIEGKNLKITLEVTDEFDTLQEESLISIYRIFNSLVHYLLNYTESNEISLLFSIQNNIITFKEIDNGKNFNLSALSYPGIDILAEIKTIVEKKNGNFSILRNNDKNETNITFPL